MGVTGVSRAVMRHPARLWGSYVQKLNRNPVQTKMATSVVAAILGDSFAQIMSHKAARRRGDNPSKYDFARTARLCLFNAGMGCLGHHYYGALDNRLPGATATTVVKKVCVDQLIFSPLCTALFYAYKCTAEGRPGDFFREVESKYIPTLKAGWSLWVPAHVLNFALVPTKHRILYANVVSIGGCFLLSRAAAGDFSKNKQPAQQMERYSGDMEAMMDINVKLD